MTKTLVKNFNFYLVSQKGSHIKLKRLQKNRTLITIIPDHKELDYGTVRGILKLAEVSEADFWKTF